MQLNGTLSLDAVITDALKALAPHMGCFTLDNPRMVSKNISIPGPVVATIASFLDGDDRPLDPVKLEKTRALAIA